MKVVGIKIAFMCGCFVESLVGGTLPMWCKQLNQSQTLLGIANAFAGGIFLAIALMHMMPEQTSNYAAMHDFDEDAFPLPFLLLICGYCLILTIDKVIFGQVKLGKNESGRLSKAGQALRRSIAELGESVNADKVDQVHAQQQLFENAVKKELVSNQTHSQNIVDTLKQAVDGEITEAMKSGDSVHAELLGARAQPKYSCSESMTPFILLIGLGAHSIFEGLALGLEQTAADTAVFALAICVHKGAAAMSLGISIQRSFPDRIGFNVALMTVFSICTPIGVLMGMALSNDNDLVEIVFTSFAAGTFLYIACSEVIIEEFSDGNAKWWKWLFFLIGIAFIVLMGLIPE